MATQNYPATFPVDNAASAKACIEAAQAAAKRNPPKQKSKSSVEIKNEIFKLVGELKDSREGLEGLLPKWTRKLAEANNTRAELVQSIERVETQVASLRNNGAPEHHPKLQALLGYDFFSKTFQRQEHRDGTLEIMQQELAGLDKRIATLKNAVETTKVRVDAELPGLKRELKAAVERESLDL